MPEPSRVDFLLITALEEERDAVLGRLTGYRQISPTHDDVRVYYVATVDAVHPGGEACTYWVVVCMVGMGRVVATAATADAIRRWSPDYVILVGIAGGLKSAGVELGDILIAEQVADYSSQKVTEEKTEIRWSAQPVDHRLLEFARSIPASAWQAEIRESRPQKAGEQPRRHVGTITTGDSVIGLDSILEKFKDSNWPKLIGVEMEAGGAAVAVHQSARRLGFFMIRSVSDQAGNKSSLKVKAWRPYACDAAAAFAFTMIRRGPVPSSARPATEASDDLTSEMSKLTFSELATVTNYLVEQPALPGADYSLLAPRRKWSGTGSASGRTIFSSSA
jgi:adenosylhomocysteine nucleosidase